MREYEVKPGPSVTVVVPAYNAAATLRRTLESVAAQTLRDFEVIVVDDGSTDDTAAIAEGMRGSLDCLRLVRIGNGGVARARNTGIEAARGRYVAPIDADDLWHPTYLEKLVQALERSGAGMAYALHRRIDEADVILRTPRAGVLDGFAFHRMIYRNAVGNGSGIVFERALALDVGGYDEDASKVDDIMMQLRLAWRQPIVCVPEFLVGYRLTANSMSSNRYTLADRSLRALDSARDLAPGCDRAIVDAAIARRAARAVFTATLKRDPRRLLHYLRVALATDPVAALAALTHPWRFTSRAQYLAEGVGESFHAADPRPPADFERKEPHVLREMARAALADEREARRRAAAAQLPTS